MRGDAADSGRWEELKLLDGFERQVLEALAARRGEPPKPEPQPEPPKAQEEKTRGRKKEGADK